MLFAYKRLGKQNWHSAHTQSKVFIDPLGIAKPFDVLVTGRSI